MPPEATLPSDADVPVGPPHARRSGPLLRIGLVLGVLAVGAALAAVAAAPAGRVLVNVRVGDVAIGRLDAAGATAALTAAGDRAAPPPPRQLAITTPDGVVAVPTADLGVHLDVGATVARALALGRTDRPEDLRVRLTALRTSTTVRPVLAADAGAVRAVVDALADGLDRPADVGDLRIDPETGRVVVVPPRRGVTVDRDAATAAVLAALADGRRTAVTLPARVVPAAAPSDRIRTLGARLADALARGLVLVGDGGRIRVEPADLAAAASVVAGTDADGRSTPELRLDRWTVARTVGARLVAALERDAVDAAFVVPSPPRFAAMGTTAFRPRAVDVAVDPGRTARRFRMDRTARQLERLIVTGRRTAAADLLELAPAVTAADLLAHAAPTHLLGTFTTFHPAGADRNVNIRRLADELDGTLIAPGADLSVNGVSGERRCEDGYLPAGTILFGELVDTCGGGVSQFGTTTYNAAFFAGLPTPQWQPHSFFIGRYPMGREATLSYPVLDVRATNDTDGWLLVRTSHTPTSVTVALYGRPRWAEVRAVHGPATDPTPFPTELRPADDLAPGEERVLQPGGDGFTVVVLRELVPPDGGPPTVERRRTVYRPQTRIVEVPPGPVAVVPAPPG